MLQTMGLARLVSRRKGTSVVRVVPFGAAVSLGVVAVTASRLSWRRTRSEEPPESPELPADTPETQSDQEIAPQPPAPEPAPRFKLAPPRDPDAPRWDTPPPALRAAGPSP
jgi:hypothetical protein